jgi:hypothetical protein
MTAIQNNPIINMSYLYKYGFVISNSPDTINTKLLISAGQCRDSNNVMDITLGFANVEGVINPVTGVEGLVLNAATVGANGLDTGVLEANTMYAIYAIADSRYYLGTAVIATKASNSAPSLPAGYDSMRLIGFWATQSANALFELGSYSNYGSNMTFMYLDERPVLSLGTSTSYAYVNLVNVVPPTANQFAIINSIYKPANPGANLLLAPGSGINHASSVITGQVSNVNVTSSTFVLVQPHNITGAIVPAILYAVGVGDTASLSVSGFNVQL